MHITQMTGLKVRVDSLGHTRQVIGGAIAECHAAYRRVLHHNITRILQRRRRS